MRNPVTVARLARGADPIATNAGSGGTRWGARPRRRVPVAHFRRGYFARPVVNATAGYETKWWRLAGAVAPRPRSRTGNSGQPTDVA